MVSPSQLSRSASMMRGFEVVADLFKPGSLGRVRSQEQAPYTCFSALCK